MYVLGLGRKNRHPLHGATVGKENHPTSFAFSSEVNFFPSKNFASAFGYKLK